MRVDTVRATPEPEKLVCQCARNDYSAHSLLDQNYEQIMEGVSGETIEEKEASLLHKLITSGHWGPLEHPQITLYLEGISRSSMAQITRHRNASFDVQSLRYTGDQLSNVESGSSLTDHFYEPPTIPDRMNNDPTMNLSQEEVDENLKVSEYWNAQRSAINHYRKLIELGVPPEDARHVLTMATRVNVVMSVNARSAMHVLNLRLKGNAQQEAREISASLERECKEWMPTAFGIFEEDFNPRQARIGP